MIGLGLVIDRVGEKWAGPLTSYWQQQQVNGPFRGQIGHPNGEDGLSDFETGTFGFVLCNFLSMRFAANLTNRIRYCSTSLYRARCSLYKVSNLTLSSHITFGSQMRRKTITQTFYWFSNASKRYM